MYVVKIIIENYIYEIPILIINYLLLRIRVYGRVPLCLYLKLPKPHTLINYTDKNSLLPPERLVHIQLYIFLIWWYKTKNSLHDRQKKKLPFYYTMTAAQKSIHM